LKNVKTKANQNVPMYISLDTDKDCNLLHVTRQTPSSRQGGRPIEKKNRNCPDYGSR